MGCLGSTRRKRLPNTCPSTNFYSEKSVNRKQQYSSSQLSRSSFDNCKPEFNEWRQSLESKANYINGTFMERAKSFSRERVQIIKEKPKRRDVFSVFADQGVELKMAVIGHDRFMKLDDTSSFIDDTQSVVEEEVTKSTFVEFPPAVYPLLQCIQSLGICYGSSSLLGNCKLMEDAVSIETQHLLDHEVAFFGVFDGHNGRDVADYLVKNLHKNILEYMQLKHEPSSSVAFGCAQTDLNIYEQKVLGGSTAIFCLVHDQELYLGSVGDSQAVLCSSGLARNMCITHKPSLATERERIEEANGKIIGDRIFGILGVSRAFGDNDFKTSRGEFRDRFEGDLVSSVPDIVPHRITSEDEFLVLGSDGIFDVMKPQQVVDFVRSRVRRSMNIQLVAEQLTEHAQTVGSMDNISVIIVCFRSQVPSSTF